MSLGGTVLTGLSLACIVAGFVLLAVQLRRRPAPPAVGPLGDRSAPAAGADRAPGPTAAASRGGASTRRRVFYALLTAMGLTAVAGAVLQERLVWGVQLFVDDVFLAYVAWLVRRAQNRAPETGPLTEPAVDESEAEDEEDEAEEEVSDAPA